MRFKVAIFSERFARRSQYSISASLYMGCGAGSDCEADQENNAGKETEWTQREFKWEHSSTWPLCEGLQAVWLLARHYIQTFGWGSWGTEWRWGVWENHNCNPKRAHGFLVQSSSSGSSKRCSIASAFSFKRGCGVEQRCRRLYNLQTSNWICQALGKPSKGALSWIYETVGTSSAASTEASGLKTVSVVASHGGALWISWQEFGARHPTWFPLNWLASWFSSLSERFQTAQHGCSYASIPQLGESMNGSDLKWCRLQRLTF